MNVLKIVKEVLFRNKLEILRERPIEDGYTFITKDLTVEIYEECIVVAYFRAGKRVYEEFTYDYIFEKFLIHNE